ncbi:MAG: alpha-amylase family protein [Muribaculaceae bacterium]|nr:alpha-amylase family protein [Muribaculaceae bacterium]
MKPIIYQLFPRWFTNYNNTCVSNGSIEQNGCGKMNGFTPQVLNSIKELGVTHIWYTGVIEHAHATDYSKYGITPDNPHVVKGKAGSPYAISDYYDIDPDIAVNVPKRREEFEALVERTHAAGMKVIIDFVPNHVARRYSSDAKPVGISDFGENDDNSNFFSPLNDFYYITRQQFSPSIDLGQGDDAYVEFPAKASGNDCFSAFPDKNDWYETVKLNYGVDYSDNSRHFDPIPPVWFKMLHILRYWASKGIDGFRCDMVFMVPLEFWRWAIPAVKKDYPDLIFIGEIYDVNIYKDFLDAGFDYLYDKVNLYDTLRAIECSNVSAAQITDCWQRIDSVKDKMLNFLENHDEQRFASEFYATDPALVIPSLVVSSTLSNGPVMIYAGQELGEPANEAEGFSGKDGRTTIFDYWSLSTLRRWLNSGKPSTEKLTDREIWLRNQYSKILSLCNKEKAISNGKFFDLMYVNYQNKTLDPHRQYVYMRYDKDSLLVIAVNFSSNSCDLMINIPQLAINMSGFKEGKYDAVELLSDNKAVKYFSSEQPFNTFVASHSAVIWKVSKKKRPDNNKK